MHPRHIVRNIEFCDAVCDFCNPGDRSLKDFEDYRNFIKYVDCNRKRWPILAEWMANQKVIALKNMNKDKADLTALTIKPENSVEVDRPVKSKPERGLFSLEAINAINESVQLDPKYFVSSSLKKSKETW